MTKSEQNSRGPRPGWVLAGAVAFAVAYGQAPLYYSNQNQYFLHGLAAAGHGLLNEDWLASTADPTPVFSGLVAVTAGFLHPWLFYVYHGLLLATYAASLVAVFVLLVGRAEAAKRWPVFLALVVLVHSAGARWLSYRLFGLDYPWYLQAGVAGQYLLGGMLQPSAFGVLLLVAVALFAHGRELAAGVCVAAAATIHTTYLLPGALLTLGFLAALLEERRVGRAAALGGLTLALVLPVTVYALCAFAPTSPESFAEAQGVLVNLRIPHHCRVDLWLDPIAAAQLLWVGVALAFVWRARLFAVIAVPTALSLLLTGVQALTGNDTLALLFPWRVFALLVPLATAVVLARLVTLPALPLDRMAWRSASAVLIVSLAGATVALLAARQGFRSGDEELRVMNFVRETKAPGDVYLIPVRVPKLAATTLGSKSSDFKPPEEKRKDASLIPPEMQRFRLYTGAPIFVDFKSIPYRDTDVLEWRDRLRVAEAASGENGRAALAEARRRGVTHVIVRAGIDLGGGLERVYEDEHYQVYRLREEH